MNQQQEIIWSVSDVNRAVRDLVENSLMPFWIRGEVSNLIVHRSGHVYLSLKDRDCQIRAAFFGGAHAVREKNLQNGELVECFGKLTVYEVRGEYQFSIKSIRLAGMGELQRRFEELKRKLDAEGLFDPARKLPIPAVPGRIGLVTSPTGAAIRDFLQIIDRRFPNLAIRLYPAKVQGAGAAQEIARGVDFFNWCGGVDVIVAMRGGGSAEDLWAFNEEIVARSIAASRIPVISAVGHEIDFTIADFVADLRAPTPSAAAELVAGRRVELEERLLRCERSLRGSVDYALLSAQRRLEMLGNSAMFREPAHLLEMRNRQLDELHLRFLNAVERRRTDAAHHLEALALRLADVDPKEQLKRGFAMITDAEGQLIVSAAGHEPGKEVTAHLADGELRLTVSG